MKRWIVLGIFLLLLIFLLGIYHKPLTGLISSIILRGEFSFGNSALNESLENRTFIPPPGSNTPSSEEGSSTTDPNQEEQEDFGGTPTEGIDEAPEESGIIASIREPEAEVLLSGAFVSQAAPAEGFAKFIEGPSERLLRFENFSIAPASYEVYLSQNLELSGAILIDDLKATFGESNYDLDEDIDLSIYDYVLIWNDELAAYAQLD